MNLKELRIGFAGTPAFAAAHLQALLDKKLQLAAVYTQPDRPAGRGKKLSPSPVKQLALDHQLAVFQPPSLKQPEEYECLKSLQLDVLVVVAYGLLLPKAILDIPRLGCINVHASLLPRWRGAAPIERAILSGDEVTGISIMQMDEGLDTGDILYQVETPISLEDTSESLGLRLQTMGCEALLNCLELLACGEVPGRPQDSASSTYADKLDKSESLIDWHRDAGHIQRQVNAFYPRSPAWCFLDDQRIRVIASKILNENSQQPPGTIVSADKTGLVIACGQACLQVTKLQLPGKKALPVADLLNARADMFAAGRQFQSQAGSS